MRFFCSSLNRSNRTIALWIAIYTSIFVNTPNHAGRDHHPIAAPVASFVLILAAAGAAWLYSRKCKTA